MTDKDKLTLKSFHVYFRDYWEDKWKYTGSIEFSNWSWDKFVFNIEDEEVKEYMWFIAKRIEKTASTFTQKLKDLFSK